MGLFRAKQGLVNVVIGLLLIALQMSSAFVPSSSRLLPRRGTLRTMAPSRLHVAAQAPATQIEPVGSLEDFERVLEASTKDDQVFAVWFQASWCRKCKYIGARLRRMADHVPEELMGSLRLFSLDVNKVAKVPQQEKIKDLPTIKFYAGGREVGSYVATDRGEVFYGKMQQRLRDALGLHES